MLHIKFQGHRSIGSGEEDFKKKLLVFIWACSHFDHVTRLICINFHYHFIISIHMKFGLKSFKTF